MMRPEVHVVSLAPEYPAFPYKGDGALDLAFERLWSSWGLDPRNPFAEWLPPGGSVLIKPNWVTDRNALGHSIDSLVTHPALIRAVMERCAVALEGRGTIVIGDCPVQGCDFGRLMKLTRMEELVGDARGRWPGIAFHIEDWRLTRFDRSDKTIRSESADQDPALAEKHRLVDRGRDSFLEEISDRADRFRVTMYDPRLMRARHAPGRHQYLLTKRAFGIDLLINLAKMKTHVKAGLTGALKNLVGLNGHKEFLPHHMLGSFFEGGDGHCVESRARRFYDASYDAFWTRRAELSSFARAAWSRWLRLLWGLSRATGGDGVSFGNWSGNETVWRMTLDLNHALYFAEDAPRKIVSIVDGVIAGEGEGPLAPSPKAAGLLVGGENPAHVDAVLARLMGYNLSRVPTVFQALTRRDSGFGGIDPREIPVSWMDRSGTPSCPRLGDLPIDSFVKPRHWRRAELGR